ncbi:MAG TPA: hypothetical protein VHW01_24445 [Polyangiaceae bacterium]|nr:hypothetical protein [Polyangiaceae bacterium]
MQNIEHIHDREISERRRSRVFLAGMIIAITIVIIAIGVSI